MEEHSSDNTATPERPPAPKQPDDATHTMVHNYVRVLLWPVLIAGIFQVVALHNQNQTLLVFITNAIIVILVLVQCTRHNATWQTAAIIGALSGAAATMVVALYKLIFTFDVIYFFNLLTEPTIMGIFDGIATGSIYIIVLSIINKFNRKLSAEKSRQ